MINAPPKARTGFFFIHFINNIFLFGGHTNRPRRSKGMVVDWLAAQPKRSSKAVPARPIPALPVALRGWQGGVKAGMPQACALAQALACALAQGLVQAQGLVLA